MSHSKSSAKRPWQYLFLASICGIYIYALVPTDALPGIDPWDKLNHGMAFFVLAGLMEMAWPTASLLRVRLPLLLLYGLLIELSQSLLPWRDGSWPDLLADAVGLLAYGLLRGVLFRRRGPVSP